jgi:hypothetical protein
MPFLVARDAPADRSASAKGLRRRSERRRAETDMPIDHRRRHVGKARRLRF